MGTYRDTVGMLTEWVVQHVPHMVLVGLLIVGALLVRDRRRSRKPVRTLSDRIAEGARHALEALADMDEEWYASMDASWLRNAAAGHVVILDAGVTVSRETEVVTHVPGNTLRVLVVAGHSQSLRYFIGRGNADIDAADKALDAIMLNADAAFSEKQ